MEITNLPKRKEIKKTESPIEDILLSWFHKYHLIPEIQYQIGKYRVDFAFPERKIAVEADGKEYHSGEEKEKYDNERNQYLISKGWKVIRAWGGTIKHEPHRVVKNVLDHWHIGKEVIGHYRDRGIFQPMYYQKSDAFLPEISYNEFLREREGRGLEWEIAPDIYSNKP